MNHERQLAQPSDGQQAFGGEKNAPRPEEPQPIHGPPAATPLREPEDDRPRPRNPWGRLGKPPSQEAQMQFQRDRARLDRALFYGQLSRRCRRLFPNLPTVNEINELKEEFEKKRGDRAIDLDAVLRERAEPLLVSERFRVATSRSRLFDPAYQGDIPLCENIIQSLKLVLAPEDTTMPSQTPEEDRLL